MMQDRLGLVTDSTNGLSKPTAQDSLDEGAATSTCLASASEVETVAGRYFARKSAAPSGGWSHDKTLGAELWRVSEQLTGVA